MFTCSKLSSGHPSQHLDSPSQLKILHSFTHSFVHSFDLLLWEGAGGAGTGKWSSARFCPEELRWNGSPL